MGNYLKIEIKTSSKEQSEILIAELSEINFYSFIQEDPLGEETDNCLSAFIKEEDFNEDELNNILLPKKITGTKTVIPDTNWNAKWESEFEPIIIDDLVAIRAAFHKPITGVKHDIIITPRMSFGTGHHATTYLMLQKMCNLNFTGKTVLDFGTGTGVLGIMAVKLGAKKVTAIDNDEWSITNAGENFAANNCTGIVLLKKEDLSGLDKFDIILANINLNVITQHISELNEITHPSSVLLLSGFLDTDHQRVLNTFSFEGYQHISTSKRFEWISMLLTKS